MSTDGLDELAQQGQRDQVLANAVQQRQRGDSAEHGTGTDPTAGRERADYRELPVALRLLVRPTPIAEQKCGGTDQPATPTITLDALNAAVAARRCCVDRAQVG